MQRVPLHLSCMIADAGALEQAMRELHVPGKQSQTTHLCSQLTRCGLGLEPRGTSFVVRQQTLDEVLLVSIGACRGRGLQRMFKLVKMLPCPL